jgi:hypothetical protein
MKKLLLISAVTMCFMTAQAQILVGTGGSGTSGVKDFATRPTVAEGWESLSDAGGAGDFTSTTTLDANVPTHTATEFTAQVGTSGTFNPVPSDNALFRHNTANLNLQSRPTGNAYSMLLATLQNDSGANISTITVAYDYGVLVAPDRVIQEEIPGHRVFWSLDGTSWSLIPELSGVTAAGALSAVVSVGTWGSGQPLYLLWADDNGSGGGYDAANVTPQEGVYTIDNFVVNIGGVVTENIAITSPTNNSNFSEGSLIPINASVSMAGAITDVSFYRDGGILIGSDTGAPYSSVYSNATLGAHTLYAVGTDNTHSITSAVININVNPNNPPTVTSVVNPATQSYLVGSTVTNTATAADSDGTIARVEFYLDGVLKFTDTTSTYNYQYDDALAGAHTVLAVAVDNVGARGSNTLSFTITNPPNVTLLLTNGSTWKYLDDTNDPALAGAWTTLGFNDSGWSNGVGELGFGDIADGRPEVTLVRQILTNTLDSTTFTNTTFYYRKVITVVDPAAFSGLILNLKLDDGAIVYINGVEVYRTNMFNGPVNHGSNALAAVAGDGAGFVTTNLPSSVLVAGPNIIAVEIHQNSITSTDTSFDLMLWGVNPSGTSLTITRTSSTTAEISWPLSTPPTALLYYTDNLNPPVNWTLETAPDVPSGGFHHVTVPTTGSMRYWTLRQ